MTKQEAKNKIEKAGGNFDVFNKWMCGQTVGLNKDGSINIYDTDVDRFIGYKCNPDNESCFDFD